MSEICVQRLVAGDDHRLRALAAVRAETDRDVNPTDPPAPVEELAAEVFGAWSCKRRLAWVATVDGELVVAVEDESENRDRLDVESFAVVPHRRRTGVADALVREALRWAAADGRTSVTFWVPTLPDGAGIAYARRCGTTMRLEERCSRVRVGDVPGDVVDAWVEQGRARADGCRLVQWVGGIADEHVPLLAAAHRAMEDMPTDDLEWAIPTMAEDDIRSFDAYALASGLLPVSTVAVSPAGDPAGFSVLLVNTHRPQHASQGDTGVLAAHRGRGLGRWLKGENLRQALAAEPRIEVIETYNAESNPWMLDINVAMGFRPHIGYQAWQGQVDAVRQVVGA